MRDPGASSLRRMLYFDQASWLPDNLLERGDRMTMAASIEARVPFLDHKLAELGLGAARPARVQRPRDQVDPAPGGQAAAPEAILKRPQGRLPRAGRANGSRGEMRELPARPSARRGLA